MAEKFSSRLSKFAQDIGWPKGCRPALKSFSVPRNFRKKGPVTQKVGDKIGQNDSETSYETVSASGSVTSLEDELSFCWDSEEATSDGQDYSSIELPRDAGISCYDSSFDALVNNKDWVVNDFSSDPCEFFRKNQPLASSSPIKRADPAISSHLLSIADPCLFFKPNKHVTCSTPIKKSTSSAPHHFWEEFKDFKSFFDLTAEEETIKEKPMLSFISPSGPENQGSANPDVEDVNDISMFLHIPYPEDPEICELDEVRMILNKSPPINQEEISNKEAPEKVSTLQLTNPAKNDLIHVYNSESKVEKKKHVDTDKEGEDIPVCCITVPPKHPIPKNVKIGREDISVCCLTVPPKHVSKIVIRGVVPAKKLLKNKRLQNRRLENIPVCCLALQARNRNKIAHEQ